ncbi:MAG: hypothetical protein ACRCY4_04630 [Brevinema sp.]
MPRHFSTWVYIFAEPLDNYKFVSALIGTLLIVLSAWVSSYFLGFSKKWAFLILLPASLLTSLSRIVINAIAVLPMLFVSLFPACLFLKNHEMPLWIKENPYQAFGLWAVFCYMGSQVYDPVYAVGSLFSGLFIIYLLGLKFFPSFFDKPIKDNKSYFFSLAVSLFYIALSMMAALKNRFLGYRLSVYKDLFTLDIATILKRMLTMSSVLLYITIFALIAIAFYAFIMLRQQKIKGEYYLQIILGLSALGAWGLVCILGSTHTDYVLWPLIMVAANTFGYLWQKNKAAQVVLPTFILAFYLSILLLYYPDGARSKLSQVDVQLMHALQKADQQGEDSVFFPEVSDQWFPLADASRLGYILGYTTKIITIRTNELEETNLAP